MFVLLLQPEHCTVASVVHLHSTYPLHTVHGPGHVHLFAWMKVKGEEIYIYIYFADCSNWSNVFTLSGWF